MMLNLGMKTWAFSGELKKKKKELEARIQQILLPTKDRVGVKFQFPDSRVNKNSYCQAQVQVATPYRPDKNGFCKQHNTKGSGPADNIYFFYQRLWPGQIANTKSSLTLALGLMHLNFYLFYWPLLKNIFSQQVLDSNLSDNDGGLVDNEDDQEKEDSPMITDNDFDFLSNFWFTMSVCLTSTHLEHSISFRSVSAL